MRRPAYDRAMSVETPTAPPKPAPPRGRQQARKVINGFLQLIGDPRWWPRDLDTPGKKRPPKLLWRTIQRAEADEWPPPATPAGGIARLRALAEAQYNETKFWFLVVTQLYVAGAALAGAAFLIAPARTWLTFLAAACQGIAAFARIRAVRLHALAYDADWRALVLDAMGPTEAELQRALLIENGLSDGARRRAGVLPNYYDSTAPPGEQRLIENLSQTAFLTGALYGGARVQAFFLAALVLMIPLIGPVYWLLTGDALPPEFGVLLVTSVLPFWDVIGRQVSWREGASTLEHVVDSLRTTRDIREALPLMVDAMTATAMAPPIPRTVYQRWVNEGLRTRWQLLSTRVGVPEASRDQVPVLSDADPAEAVAETPHAPLDRVGDPGLEPGTSSLSEKRSNRLS